MLSELVHVIKMISTFVSALCVLLRFSPYDLTPISAPPYYECEPACNRSKCAWQHSQYRARWLYTLWLHSQLTPVCIIPGGPGCCLIRCDVGKVFSIVLSNSIHFQLLCMGSTYAIMRAMARNKWIFSIFAPHCPP